MLTGPPPKFHGTRDILVWVTCEDSWGDHRNAVVQGPPLPGRDHQPLRVAVLQVPA